MPKITARMIVNLMLACLLVGPISSMLNIDPRDILESGQDAIEWLLEVGGEISGWAITYILIGATLGNSDLAGTIYSEIRPRSRVARPLLVIVFQAGPLGFVLPSSPRSTDSGKKSRDLFEQ